MKLLEAVKFIIESGGQPLNYVEDGYIKHSFVGLEHNESETIYKYQEDIPSSKIVSIKVPNELRGDISEFNRLSEKIYNSVVVESK